MWVLWFHVFFFNSYNLLIFFLLWLFLELLYSIMIQQTVRKWIFLLSKSHFFNGKYLNVIISVKISILADKKQKKKICYRLKIQLVLMARCRLIWIVQPTSNKTCNFYHTLNHMSYKCLDAHCTSFWASIILTFIPISELWPY